MHDCVRACEAEFADMSARLASVASSAPLTANRSLGLLPGQHSPTLGKSAVPSRLDRMNRKLDALERRVGPQYATDRSVFVRSADAVYNEIQRFIGLPRLDDQLRGLQDAKKEDKPRMTGADTDAQPWSPSCAQRDPSLSALTSKYVAAGPSNTVACPNTGAEELVSKYSVPRPGVIDSEEAAMEETTMELRSQLIFSALNRKPGQGSSRPASIPPEPIAELADLPAIGPAPRVETSEAVSVPALLGKIDDGHLEVAIAAALAKACDVHETKVTPGMRSTATTATTATTSARATTPSATRLSLVMASKSAAKSSLALSNTPMIPTILSAWRSVEEGSYGMLPGFVRNQISLEELNATSLAVHGVIARRVESGSTSVVFTAADVAEHTSKGKAFVNALVKLNMIKLKVYRGDQIVHYFT